MAIFDRDSITKRIFTLRDVQVMLDSDLACLYEVPVKALNQAVKRNRKRFPENFMFQLRRSEYQLLKCRPEDTGPLRSQSVTSKRGGRTHLPYVFTGVSMLSGVLRSEKAIEMSIQIINAFVTLRRFIFKNAGLFGRIHSLEKNQVEYQIRTDERFERIFEAIEDKTLQKRQGIFYDGQIFDAHALVCQIIRSAKISLVIIDNFLDESILILLAKKEKPVKVTIYTKSLSRQLMLDVERFNAQYGGVYVSVFGQYHDRFIIVDGRDIYHFGASLKDLGKKWFAVSMFEEGAVGMLKRLKGADIK